MSFGAKLDAAALTVLLDLRHPLAFLALGPAIVLGLERGIEIDWLPMTAPPLKPPSIPSPDDDRGLRHRRNRAHMIAREIETYAALQGLVLQEPYRDGDAAAANLAWLWVRERAPSALPALLVELFRAYWALELDPADARAVAPLVRQATGEETGGVHGFLAWAEDPGPVVAGRLAEELVARGLTGVPGYFIEGEFFLGRQHLPMIRWILAGRSGRGPI